MTGKSERLSLTPVLAVNFIGTMGFSIVIPFLVFLVDRFGGNAFVYGLVAATYPAFQFVGSPILGRWSDRYGRRKILMVSQAGTLLSWLIFSVALFIDPVPLLTIESSIVGSFSISGPLLIIGLARALDGLTGGNISVANAYVADVSSEADRNANFGKMGVAANLGMILGPTLAGILGATALKESLPVYAAAAISVAALLIIFIRLPESNPRVARKDCSRAEAGQSLGLEPRCALKVESEKTATTREVLRQPGVLYLLTLYFVILLSFNFFYTAFPIHVSGVLGWTVTDIGIFFAVMSLMLVIVEGPVLARLSKRFSETRLIVVGLAVLAASFVVMTTSATPLIYGAAVLFAIGNGIMWPSIVSVVSKTAAPRFQGAVQGAAGSAGSLASVIGLTLGGIIYGTAGAATFIISGAIAGLACLLAFRLPRRKPLVAGTESVQ